MLIIFILIIIIFFTYLYYTRIYRIKKFLNNFPSPPRKPFVGNVIKFNPSIFLYKLHEYTRKYGDNLHLQLGPVNHALFTSNKQFLEFLLSDNKLINKMPQVKFLNSWIGNGLITADGNTKWRAHRKIITPAFHFTILEQFIDVFEACGNVLVEKFKEVSDKQSVDIYPYISKFSLEAISETSMGTKMEVQNNETNLYFESVKKILKILLIRSISPLLTFDLIFRFTKHYSIQGNAVKIVNDYTNQIIKTRRETLSEMKKNNQNREIDELGRKKKKTFLDIILEAKIDNQSLTEQEIKDEVNTFMFAGYDTTATAMSFILWCIAQNQDVQERILQEQKELFEDFKNPNVTYKKLQEMKYLENVIREGLRMYPPVPVIGRVIHKDTNWNGTTIPKNTDVIVFIHGVHMNPEIYPNPKQFDPSRFESIDKKNNFCYIPFSAGARNCIGQKYAMLEMKSMLSKIVRNFELVESVPQHKLCLSIETVLKSLNGVKIGLKLRK